MATPVWFVRLIKLGFPRRALLARLTRVPLLGRGLERLLFEGDRLLYLPRQGTLLVDEAVDRPGDVVLPSRVVEHFVRQAGYHVIMNRCLCRDATHCRDYPIELGCLFLGEAALQINPALGRRVTADEALDHVRRCREAGLVHLIGRNKLDTVWLGVGPGDKLMTICNCCPCCCLWRILPQVSPEIGGRVTRMPGVSVAVTGRCVGCGTCTQGVCFVDAVRLQDGRASISDACRGCGRCAAVCPQSAIEVRVENGACVEEAIQRLAPLVDLASPPPLAGCPPPPPQRGGQRGGAPSTSP